MCPKACTAAAAHEPEGASSFSAISGQHTSRTALFSILPHPAFIYQESRNWKNIPFPLGCQLLQRSPCSRERGACTEQRFQDLAEESLPAWAPCTVTGARRRETILQRADQSVSEAPLLEEAPSSPLPPAHRLPQLCVQER